MKVYFIDCLFRNMARKFGKCSLTYDTRGHYGRVYEVKTRTAPRRQVFLVHRKILRQVDRRRGDVVYEPSQEEYDHFAKVYGRAKYHKKHGKKTNEASCAAPDSTLVHTSDDRMSSSAGVFHVVACDGPLPVDYRASPYSDISDISSCQDIDYMLDFDNIPELSSRIWFDPDVLGASPRVSRGLTSMESTEPLPAVQMSYCSAENRSIPDSSQQGPQLSQQGNLQQDQDQDFSAWCQENLRMLSDGNCDQPKVKRVGMFRCMETQTDAEIPHVCRKTWVFDVNLVTNAIQTVMDAYPTSTPLYVEHHTALIINLPSGDETGWGDLCFMAYTMTQLERRFSQQAFQLGHAAQSIDPTGLTSLTSLVAFISLRMA
jgi:hypothetical protein